MPKPATGVYLRRESRVYQWRVRVHESVRHLYPGQTWAKRQTLGTANLREANAKATRLYAEYLAECEQERQLRALPCPQTTDDLRPLTLMASGGSEDSRNAYLSSDSDLLAPIATCTIVSQPLDAELGVSAATRPPLRQTSKPYRLETERR